MGYDEWEKYTLEFERDFSWHDIKEIAYAWCKASSGYDEKTDEQFENIWKAQPTGNRITYRYIISKYQWDYPFADTPTSINFDDKDVVVFFIQCHFCLLIHGGVSLLIKKELETKDLLKIKPIKDKSDYRIVIASEINTHRLENNLKAIDTKTVNEAIDKFLTHPTTEKYSSFISLPPKVKVPDGAYNLWNNYAYVMKFNHGEYEVCKNPDDNIVYLHRKELLAKDDEGLLNYLMCLRAFKHMNPHIKTQVCPIILGEQGTGKGIYTSLEKAIYMEKVMFWLIQMLKISQNLMQSC